MTLGFYQQFNRYVVFNHMFKSRQYGYQYGVGDGGVIEQLDKVVAGYWRRQLHLHHLAPVLEGPGVQRQDNRLLGGEIQIQRAFNNAQPSGQLGHGKPFIACGFKIGPSPVEYFLPAKLLLRVSNRATFQFSHGGLLLLGPANWPQ